MIPRSVYALWYGPCKDSWSFLGTLSKSSCYENYNDWSLQPVHVANLDYSSYGTGDHSSEKITLSYMWANKNDTAWLPNFNFENLITAESTLT